MAAASFPLGPSHPSTNSPSPPSPRSGVWKPTKAGAAPQTPPRDPPQVQPLPPEAWLRPLPNPKRRVGGDPKASGPYRMDEACSPNLSPWEVLRAVTILVTDPKFTLLATNVPCGWHFVPVASS